MEEKECGLSLKDKLAFPPGSVMTADGTKYIAFLRINCLHFTSPTLHRGCFTSKEVHSFQTEAFIVLGGNMVDS